MYLSVFQFNEIFINQFPYRRIRARWRPFILHVPLDRQFIHSFFLSLCHSFSSEPCITLQPPLALIQPRQIIHPASEAFKFKRNGGGEEEKWWKFDNKLNVFVYYSSSSSTLAQSHASYPNIILFLKRLYYKIRGS